MNWSKFSGRAPRWPRSTFFGMGGSEGTEFVTAVKKIFVGTLCQPSDILEGYQEDGVRLFTVVHGRRVRSNRCKLKQRVQAGYEKVFVYEDHQALEQAACSWMFSRLN